MCLLESVSLKHTDLIKHLKNQKSKVENVLFSVYFELFGSFSLVSHNNGAFGVFFCLWCCVRKTKQLLLGTM